MDQCRLVEELGAYRDLLQSGKLTELDLDALGVCLSEALALLDILISQSDDAQVLKQDVMGEIASMSIAATALNGGRQIVDKSKLLDELTGLDASRLLQARARARTLVNDLQRSGRMPVKTTVRPTCHQSIEDFRIGDERVG